MNHSQQITLQRKSIWDVIKDFFKAIGRFFFSAFSSEVKSKIETPILAADPPEASDPKVNYSISVTETILVDDPKINFNLTFEPTDYTSNPSTASIEGFQIDVFISTNSDVIDGDWTYLATPNLTINGFSLLDADKPNEGLVGIPMTRDLLDLKNQQLEGPDLFVGTLYGIKMVISGLDENGVEVLYHGTGISENTINSEFYAQ